MLSEVKDIANKLLGLKLITILGYTGNIYSY